LLDCQARHASRAQRMGHTRRARHRIGTPLIDCFTRIKRAELARFEQATDKDERQRREHFSRF